MAPSTYNQPVPGIPYFIPSHAVSPGTPTNSPINANKKIPTLFTPLRIRGTTLRNRTIVAPMCQYSTAESGPAIGALTPYHISTLGHYALKGAALVFIEATGVQPNGRISPNCPGLWSDDQIPGVKAVADFIHAQNSLVGMQLAHAGRKASTVSPWVASRFMKPSMRADAEAQGARQATGDDPRITPLGRFLRSVRLDELPQFFNVLRGELSLIGPRPEQVGFVEKYREAIPFYDQRHLVRPGITGWAQVQGRAGIPWEQRIELDVEYVERRSAALDARILLKTLWLLVTGHGLAPD